MNWLPILRYIWRVAALAILVLCGTLWAWPKLAWTPVQRYYLSTYLRCSIPGADQASLVEIRWLYKTAANTKRELALEDDAMTSPSNSDNKLPIKLSPAARQAGWTGLIQGPQERLQIAALKPRLNEQFFDGQSFWIMLLLPTLCGFVLFCLLLYGLSWLEDWIAEAPWRAQRLPWEEPSPTLLERCIAKGGEARSWLSKWVAQGTRTTAPKPASTAPAAAPVEPSSKPPQFVLSPLNVSDGMRREGFLWTEKDEIE